MRHIFPIAAFVIVAALFAGCSPKVAVRTEVRYVDSLRIRDSVRFITERNTVTTNLYEYVKDSTSVDVQDSVSVQRLNDSTVLMIVWITKTVERHRERESCAAAESETELTDSTAVKDTEKASASSDVTEERVVRERYTPPFLTGSTIVLWVIVAAALGYGGWRLYRRIRG